MSWLTRLAHGDLTPGQFLAKAAAELRDLPGDFAVKQGASYVIDNAEHYKAAIEAATRAYLTARLGTDLGAVAANLADLAVDALAGTIEAAAQAVEAGK